MATSLNQIRLQPGKPFPFPQLPTFNFSSGSSAFSEVPVKFSLWILVISTVLTPIVLVTMFLSSKKWRKWLTTLLILNALILLSLVSVQEFVPKIDPKTRVTIKPIERNEIVSTISVSSPPKWAICVVILLIAIILATISITFIRLFLRPPEPKVANGGVAKEAQNALHRLELGDDLRETILHCYREMILVVRKAQGIVREQHMTPREFEILLESNGLPAQSVLQLTRLFEEVRYGGEFSGRHTKSLAIKCLRDIVAVCQAGELHED